MKDFELGYRESLLGGGFMAGRGRVESVQASGEVVTRGSRCPRMLTGEKGGASGESTMGVVAEDGVVGVVVEGVGGCQGSRSNPWSLRSAV